MSRFCSRCQRDVVAHLNEDDCPECGERLSDIAQEPTVDLQANEWTSRDDSPPPRTTDSLIGQTVDHYRIERFLGRGGMARVYLAQHLELERPCAIKLLRHRGSASDEERMNAFLHEARAAAALAHPHVVTIHTLGRVADQRFIDMEFVDGCSLAQHVMSTAPLEPLEATRIMLQIGSAPLGGSQHQHHSS